MEVTPQNGDRERPISAPGAPTASDGVPASTEFSRYRRSLPHWRLSGAIYFVTWRLHKLQVDLRPEEQDRLVSVLRHFNGERYELFAFVVMNDHIHVLVKPLGEHRLEQILHSWKSFSARRFQRESARAGSIWQEEYFDRVVRDEDEFWEKAEYILSNPKKRWPGTDEYRWSWLRKLDEPGTSARPAQKS